MTLDLSKLIIGAEAKRHVVSIKLIGSLNPQMA